MPAGDDVIRPVNVPAAARCGPPACSAGLNTIAHSVEFGRIRALVSLEELA
jgi:hypothetical protein